MQILSALHQADQRLFAWLFESGERYLLTTPARAVSHTGDGHLHVLLPLLLVLAGADFASDLVLLLALGIACERPLYWVLKNSLRRRRPYESVPGLRAFIVASDKFSFPSGHSSAAFLLATSLCLVYGAGAAILLGWASLVALSRIILGVHFPGDIIAGAGMGTGLAILSGFLLGIY